MAVSLEMQQQIEEWRAKVRDGTISIEDMKNAVTFLRGERIAMAPTKSSKKQPTPNGRDLLAELGL